MPSWYEGLSIWKKSFFFIPDDYITWSGNLIFFFKYLNWKSSFLGACLIIKSDMIFNRNCKFYIYREANDSILTRSAALKESVYCVMTSGPQLITTLLIIKPRAVKRHLPKIIKKIVQEGFKVVGMRLQVLSEEDIQYLTKNDDNMVFISLY